jgi:MOSC domain-containing protein YiiM
MTTLAQGNLPKDNGILRTAVQQNEGNVGVYAKVVQGGAVKRGDRLNTVA